MMMIALPLLCVAIAEKTELPDWQREILETRHAKSRASIHRSTYPESEGLKDAGRSIALGPVDRTVIVGMTTTPTRISYIAPTIAALRNQTQALTVIVNIPRTYNDRRNHWKNKVIEVPSWLRDQVIVHFVHDDFGPATKLIGTAIALAKPEIQRQIPGYDSAIIIAADDDHEWEPFAIATLVNHLSASESQRRRDDVAVWSYYTYPFPRTKELPQVCVAQAGDLLAAPFTAFRNASLFVSWGNELLSEYNGRIPSCFFVDDLFFAAFFRHNFDAPVYTHPWRFWLFKEVRHRQQLIPIAPCRGACSPVTIRFRYPDSLAMGKPREKHNANCLAQLQALNWWPLRSHDGDVCLTG